jgi:hypothetical protein
MDNNTLGNNGLLKNKTQKIIFFILIIIAIFVIIVPWNKIIANYKNGTEKEEKKEQMTAGTLTQLFSNDSQDVYLKAGVDKTATGNFDLYWNQPTRVANTYLNRGYPLPSINLPDTGMNPNLTNSYESNDYGDLFRNNVGCSCKKPKVKQDEKEVILTQTRPGDKLFDKAYDNLVYNKDCLNNPASCAGGAGGYRLGEDFNKPTRAKEFVRLDGKLFYPDSYVGSYYTDPNFDINKPYPIMPRNQI